MQRCKEILARARGRTDRGYAVLAARYADFVSIPLADLIVGAPLCQNTDIAMVFWLIVGGGRVILADCGFHRDTFRAHFSIRDYQRPDDVLRQIGIVPRDVTDIVISHLHWDHVGGIDLFPAARIWLQHEEYRFYGQTRHPEEQGVDPYDLYQIRSCLNQGRLHLIGGGAIEIIPGIRVFTGGRHTFSSQYLLIDGNPPVVLASDELYFYPDLQGGRPSVTFEEADASANLLAQAHMSALAGHDGHVVPSHDPRQFERFPAEGRFAIIREV